MFGQEYDNLVALKSMSRPESGKSRAGGELAKCITWYSFRLPCTQMDRRCVRTCHCPFSAQHKHEWVRPLPGWVRAGSSCELAESDAEVQSSRRWSRQGLRDKSLLRGYGQRQVKQSITFPGRSVLTAVGAGNWKSR